MIVTRVKQEIALASVHKEDRISHTLITLLSSQRIHHYHYCRCPGHVGSICKQTDEGDRIRLKCQDDYLFNGGDDCFTGTLATLFVVVAALAAGDCSCWLATSGGGGGGGILATSIEHCLGS